MSRSCWWVELKAAAVDPSCFGVKRGGAAESYDSPPLREARSARLVAAFVVAVDYVNRSVVSRAGSRLRQQPRGEAGRRASVRERIT